MKILKIFLFICFYFNLYATYAYFSLSKFDKLTFSENLPKKIQQGIQTGNITDTIVLGGGCFWCMEAVFLQTKGVVSVTSGYAGGKVKNPSYEEVCSGKTGHAEVIEVIFDHGVISLGELLEIFFSMHDPTTLNRQGADEGEQYRSIILYRNIQQKKISEKIISAINKEKIFDRPVVTQVMPYQIFYPAEDYHQNYYNRNRNKGYCRMVILPKMEKFEKLFKKYKRN